MMKGGDAGQLRKLVGSAPTGGKPGRRGKGGKGKGKLRLTSNPGSPYNPDSWGSDSDMTGPSYIPWNVPKTNNIPRNIPINPG